MPTPPIPPTRVHHPCEGFARSRFGQLLVKIRCTALEPHVRGSVGVCRRLRQRKAAGASFNSIHFFTFLAPFGSFNECLPFTASTG